MPLYKIGGGGATHTFDFALRSWVDAVSAKDYGQEGPVHGSAHDVGQNCSRSADQSADNRQQIVSEHKT